MHAPDITLVRARLCSLQVELGIVAGAMETVEETRRLPTIKTKDRAAIAEACCDARDALMQVEQTAAELWALVNKHATS